MENGIILKWLNGSGNGYGYGKGYGDGSGYSSGYGHGYGDGNGSGYSDGDGDGYGDGSSSGFGFEDGSGYGDGLGSGFSSKDGSGYGDGSRFDSGYEDGSGSGSGSGEKLVRVKSYDVFYIDTVPTIITSIFGNYAKGFIIAKDYQLIPCFIAKEVNGYFAHGKTLKSAVWALEEKIINNMSVDNKIELFCKNFDKNKKYKGTEFFKWHNILTGSCLFGRNQFVKDNNLDINAKYTVIEFIKLTQHSYGGNIITKLKQFYN